MKAIGLIFILSLFIFSSHQAAACECLHNQNAQQAAQGKNKIVARVKTLKLGDFGQGELQIEEVLKGKVKDKKIKVHGGDGGNCFGHIIEDKKNPWIVIMDKYDDGYYVSSCADSSLEIEPQTKKIKFTFDYGTESVNLTQKEFVRLINLKILPTVHGLSCTLESGRYFSPGHGPDYEHPLDFGYDTKLSSNGLEKIIKEADFSEKTTGASKLRVVINTKKLSRYKYQIDSSIREPFFNEHVGFTDIVDIRQRFGVNSAYTYLTTDMDLTSVEADHDGDELHHNTSVDCSLRAGLPLIYLD